MFSIARKWNNSYFQLSVGKLGGKQLGDPAREVEVSSNIEQLISHITNCGTIPIEGELYFNSTRINAPSGILKT
jgi:hypothetical protein